MLSFVLDTPGAVSYTHLMDVMINPPKPGDASYELFEKEKNGILDSLKIRAKKLSTALNKLDGVSCLSVDGALYTYFRLTMPPKAIEAAKKQGKAADLMYCMDLLNEAGVVCVPGSGFGQEEGTYHVRSTIPVSYTHLSHQEALVYLQRDEAPHVQREIDRQVEWS